MSNNRLTSAGDQRITSDASLRIWAGGNTFAPVTPALGISMAVTLTLVVVARKQPVICICT